MTTKAWRTPRARIGLGEVGESLDGALAPEIYWPYA
jgi:hypothetical protein